MPFDLPTVRRLRRRGGIAISPAALFASNEVGVWYDPSDLTTLFTDTTGSTPVTAAGQSVALMLDKSKRTFFESRRNLLTYSEDFADASWTKANSSVTANALIAPNGTLTADSLVSTITGGSNTAYVDRVVPVSTSTNYTYSVYIKKGTSPTSVLNFFRFSPFSQVVGIINWSTETMAVAGAILLGSSFIHVGNGWYRASLTINSGTATSLVWRVYVRGAGTDNVSGEYVHIWGAQLEPGSTATAYQPIAAFPTAWPGNHAVQATASARPIYRVDANGRSYLEFDGTDDSMATSAINFTGTDKMTVFAGVRKLSDAAVAVLAELGPISSTTDGTFGLFAPIVLTGDYRWRNRGTLVSDANAPGFSAPDTAVLAATANISADTAALRRNGVQVATSSQDMGTGNYANQPLYIGRRASTSLPFNGHIYGLIVRGAQSTDSQITNTETWLNGKTGAY
jgi:hypothetical protein